MLLVMTAAILARQQGIDLETGADAPILSSKYLTRLASRCQGR